MRSLGGDSETRTLDRPSGATWANRRAALTSLRDVLSYSIDHFQEVDAAAWSTRRTESLKSDSLAPQIELELGAFWLTALVVFSESAPQEQNFNHVLQDRCIIAELVVWRGRLQISA